MIDLKKAIEPKSDQLNADDLITGPITIKITGVKVVAGEQPVSISYEGDNGKPWKPCKSTLRALIQAWNTSDGEKFVGKSVTLYLEPSVKWAGQAVGGIRISHMSDIQSEVKFMLTESQGRKAKCVIQPLQIAPKVSLTDEKLAEFQSAFDAAKTMADSQKISGKIKSGGFDDDGLLKLRAIRDEANARIREGAE